MEIQLIFFPILISAILVCGLLTTYCSALFLKTLKTKIPLISSFGGGIFSRQIFAVTMMVGSVLWIQMFIVYFLIIINQADNEGYSIVLRSWIHILNSARFVTSMIAGVNFGLIGVFNYKGESFIHIGVTNGFLFFAIFSFFLDGFLGIALVTEENRTLVQAIIAWRLGTALFACYFSYGFCSLWSHAHRSTDLSEETDFEESFAHKNTSPTDSASPVDVEVIYNIPLSLKVAAVVEYAGVLLLCAALLSYLPELQNSSISLSPGIQ